MNGKRTCSYNTLYSYRPFYIYNILNIDNDRYEELKQSDTE